MSVNLPNYFIQQYATNVQLLLQQKGSKLRGTVMEGMHKGKQASPVDQVGAVAAQRVTQRFQPMGRVDASLDRRWVFPVDYDLPQLVDTFDELRIVTDPKSAFVQNAVFAMGRAMDDEILSCVFGTAKTGEQGATSTTFPSGQIVAVDQGSSGNSGMSVAKLREAIRLMLANEVDLETDPLYCPINSVAHDKLLQEIKVTSLDYNDKPVLMEGKVTRFLGVNFIHCERVNTVTYREIPVWAKSGMHLGMWGDISTDISQRKDIQSLPWQAYCKGSFGATRLEEKKVVKILCAE